MKCYKLIFDSKYFKKNAGNFILLIFIIFYLVFSIFYIMRRIKPLEIETSHFIFVENLNKNKDNIEIVKPSLVNKDKNHKRDIKNKKNKENPNPPRKSKGKTAIIPTTDKKVKEGKFRLIDIITNKRRSIFKKSHYSKRSSKVKNETLESIKSDKVIKRKSIVDYQKEKERESKIFIGLDPKYTVEVSKNV